MMRNFYDQQKINNFEVTYLTIKPKYIFAYLSRIDTLSLNIHIDRTVPKYLE